MIRQVYLHGWLGEKYGHVHRFQAKSVAKVMSLLQANFPDFYNLVRPGSYHVVFGEDLEKGSDLSNPELSMNFPKGAFHIVPVIEGAKKGGFLNIILGVTMIAAAVFLGPASFLGAMGMKTMIVGGALMALGGIASLLSPTIKPNKTEAPEDKKSFLFDGGLNSGRQGVCVPIVYGTFMAGGIVVNAGIRIEQLI